MSKLILSFLLLFVLSFSVEVVQEEGVYVLTDSAFDEFIKEHTHALVEFYAPWCGHCKKLAPEYAKAAAKLQKQESPVVLCKVDATAEKTVSERFGVKGYPTLKFFINGAPIEYTGGRTEDEIVNWVTKKSGSPVREISDAAALDKLMADNEIVLVYFGSKDTKIYKVFESVAQGIDDASFALVTDENLRIKERTRERHRFVQEV
jgi:protein disulfide-isomerase A1